MLFDGLVRHFAKLAGYLEDGEIVSPEVDIVVPLLNGEVDLTGFRDSQLGCGITRNQLIIKSADTRMSLPVLLLEVFKVTQGKQRTAT